MANDRRYETTSRQPDPDTSKRGGYESGATPSTKYPPPSTGVKKSESETPKQEPDSSASSE
jgi:hypothetical protein